MRVLRGVQLVATIQFFFCSLPFLAEGKTSAELFFLTGSYSCNKLAGLHLDTERQRI